MTERYNVYFAGQVVAGCDPASVRAKLARVFNADQATLDKLFSGKTQLIKRDCDQATALQFKASMERAGAVAIIKVTEGAPARAMTAAEKIAALAAAPDTGLYSAGATAKAPPESAPEPGAIALAAPGTAVLREHERAVPITRDIDTAGLAVDTTAERLSAERPPPPVAPDTGHLTLGAVGDAIPNLPRSGTPLTPAVDGLTLSAPGTDFSDCAVPEAQALPLDLSALAVLPPGALLLDEQYRRRDHAAVPATDHISLQD